MGYWLVGEKRSKGLFSYHIEFLCHTNYKSSFRLYKLYHMAQLYICVCVEKICMYIKKHK